MSSSAERPSGPRHPAVVWSRRLRLRLWAWRLVGQPITPDVARDPSLRDAVLARDGAVCACCGADGGPRSDPPPRGFEVDHRRPLWARGVDLERNAWVLCRECHAAKSRAEATVRALNRRAWSRLSFTRPRPALAVFGVLFAAGLVTSRWVAFSLLALCVLWFGPPVWRTLRPWWTGRSMGGGGFNRQPDFDRILEERQGGIAGTVSRRYWWWRRLFFSARYLPMAAMVTYLAGVALRNYWDEAAVGIVRLLV